MKITPYREAAERLPQAQPEYWWERVNCRDMEILDGNQRLYAERLVRRLMTEDPGADLDESINYAVTQARSFVPTTKEAARAVAEMRSGPTYCYLAFHGFDGVATFLKIGISNHPEKRVYGLATGNPMDCLWVFACGFGSRRAAYHIEQALLRHLSNRKRRGEWICLEGHGKSEAVSLAHQLGLVAKSIEKTDGDFALLGYTDGRAVA